MQYVIANSNLKTFLEKRNIKHYEITKLCPVIQGYTRKNINLINFTKEELGVELEDFIRYTYLVRFEERGKNIYIIDGDFSTKIDLYNKIINFMINKLPVRLGNETVKVFKISERYPTYFKQIGEINKRELKVKRSDLKFLLHFLDGIYKVYKSEVIERSLIKIEEEVVSI